MRRFISLLLIIMISLSLTGCLETADLDSGDEYASLIEEDIPEGMDVDTWSTAHGALNLIRRNTEKMKKHKKKAWIYRTIITDGIKLLKESLKESYTEDEYQPKRVELDLILTGVLVAYENNGNKKLAKKRLREFVKDER